MLNNKLLLLLLPVAMFLLSSCDNPPSSPYVAPYGVQGKIMNTLGNPIQGVKVYCAFFSYEIDTINYTSSQIRKILHPDSLSFSLEQNYPNPFYNSTFFRFTIPQKCSVSYSIAPLNNTGHVFYSNTSDLMPAYYQVYLGIIAQKYQLPNGFYILSFTAKADDKTTYSGTLKMLLISDVGPASSTSNQEGSYQFDYSAVSKDDSVLVNQDPDGYSNYYQPLGNNVNLLFRKEGYKDHYQSFYIFPGLMPTEDIIMQKEEN